MTNQAVIIKLEKLEKELLKIKKKGTLGFGKKTISLKGILKGVKITEDEIKKSKKAFFKEIKN